MTLGKSFQVAGRGLYRVWKEERSFQIQVVAAISALTAMCLFSLRTYERLLIILIVGLVLLLEILNSVLERFVDMFKPRLHFAVGAVKDMMAGAVLLMSLVALIIGLFIFIPHIYAFVLQYKP